MRRGEKDQPRADTTLLRIQYGEGRKNKRLITIVVILNLYLTVKQLPIRPEALQLKL